MTFEHCLIFITFCGLLGIFMRRNFLNVQVSLLQIVMGLNALLSLSFATSINGYFYVFIIVFLIFVLIIFFQAIAILLIRRRSTLNINELTELRG